MDGRSQLIAIAMAPTAHASLFHGETLDAVADVMAWIVLFIAPIVAIGVFLIIHILPEKIAEKNGIRSSAPSRRCACCRCLRQHVVAARLVVGTKPVVHKLAYGTDKEPHGGGDALHPLDDASKET